MARDRILALLVLSVACSFAVGCAKNKPPVAELGKRYETFQGIRAGAAKLKNGNKELEIYLGIGKKEEGGEYPGITPEEPFAEVLWCKAWNHEKDALIEIADLINKGPGDQPIFLYGQRKTGERFKQYYGELDCVFYAVGVYHPDARKHVYLDAAYGTSWKYGISWSGFVKKILADGAKKGIKVIVP